jgi:hypothetical protein
MEVSGLFHSPAAYSGGKIPPHPFHRRLGGPQKPSGLVKIKDYLSLCLTNYHAMKKLQDLSAG